MQEFWIAPATGRAIWFIVLVPGLVLALATGLMGTALIGARSARFKLSPDGLRLRGDVYGRVIPASQLRTAEATRVDRRSRMSF